MVVEEQLRSLVSLPATVSAGLSGLQSRGPLFLILFELHLSPLALTLALTDSHSATEHKSSHLQVPELPGLGNDGREVLPPHGGFHRIAQHVGKHGQAQDSRLVGVCDGYCHVDLEGTSSVPKALGFTARVAAGIDGAGFMLAPWTAPALFGGPEGWAPVLSLSLPWKLGDLGKCLHLRAWVDLCDHGHTCRL